MANHPDSTEPTEYEENGFVSRALHLEDKSLNTIRLFNRGDVSYSTIGEDASVVSECLFGSGSSCKSCIIAGTRINVRNFSHTKLEKVLTDLLLIKRLKIEIWKEIAKENKFELVCQASPGNLEPVHDILLSSNQYLCCNKLVAIQFKQQSINDYIVSACMCDGDQAQISWCEFPDSESLEETEIFLLQSNPSECIFSNDAVPQKVLSQILERLKILATPMNKKKFHSELYSKDTIEEIFHQSTLDLLHKVQIELPNAFRCLYPLIEYKKLTADSKISKERFFADIFHHNAFANLDRSALLALSVFPTSGITNNSKQSCLFNLLNKCQTLQGTKVLSCWLRQPLRNKVHIETRLDLVECFFNSSAIVHAIQNQVLRQFPDLAKISSKLKTGKAKLHDCMRIYYGIKSIPRLCSLLSSIQNAKSSILYEEIIKTLEETEKETTNYILMIDSVLDLSNIDSGFNDGNEIKVKHTIDEELVTLYEEINSLEREIESHFNKIVKELGLDAGKKIKSEYSSLKGYYFRVSAKDSQIIRSNNKFSVIDSQKDGIKFVDAKMSTLSSKLVGHNEQYHKIQQKYVLELLRVSAGYNKPFTVLNSVIAKLDVILSFASLANSSVGIYVRPKILSSDDPTTNRRIVIKGSRHPCIELQNDGCFISNDVNLEHGKNHFLVITGPNMGGKSTYIRQVALTVMMAQIGCFVPASEAEISIVDKIFTRVGATDYSLRGLSTFMAEMIDASAILKTCTGNSLVLIDELGRGTSTYDGFGLAYAISEYLASKCQCFTLFATHFHQLSTLENECQGVQNLHFEATTVPPSELVMMYQAKPGFWTQSYGVNVARLVGFPEEVIQDAEAKVSAHESSENNSSNSKILQNDACRLKFKNEVTKLSEICDYLPEDQILHKIGEIKQLLEIESI